ncbi:hydroxymethylpyrimidine ABC transporter substrate-binding protein [Klebsiella pneumoniae]|nr:hydroxymethylpyrimidine ABC transporter substrate-binding protein [Klebsiella pneumoniae]
MKKSLFAGATLTALFSGHALANEPLTLVLDWYINPDHAPIMVAEQIGAFKAQGLDVRIVPPSDPALPPRMVAARQADLAITYQPQVHFFADEGLPLVRVGTLINSPLNTVIALDKQIKTPADLHPATRLDDNPYASWIRNYGDEGYLQGVSAALALLETVWQQRGSEARITELSEIFTTATRLEAQFWQMGLNAAAETRA